MGTYIHKIIKINNFIISVQFTLRETQVKHKCQVSVTLLIIILIAVKFMGTFGDVFFCLQECMYSFGCWE